MRCRRRYLKRGGDTGLFHPDVCRKLTVAELKRLASFPDGFRFADKHMDKDNPTALSGRALESWNETRPGASHHKLYGHVKLSLDRPSNTLTKFNGENLGFFHPAQPRRLSSAEYARLGGFPDQFDFGADWTDVINQIGNCVPPLLMRAVAEECAGIRRKYEGGSTMKRLLGTSLRDASKTYVRDLDEAWKAHLAPRRRNAPTVVSLFAGCGGSSLGFSMAGYRELLAVEWDAKACATFRLNFPDVPVHEGDIALLTNRMAGKLTSLKPGELDVLDGSPPCQGFSTAGKRMIDDPRNQLFREYVRLLRYFRPKRLVMENVTGMVKGGMLPTFHEIMRELRSCGYIVKSRVLNAMHYGVPQARQRVIFIGSRVGEPEFPEPWSEPITVRDAWAGLDFATGHFTEAKKGSKTRRALDGTGEGATLTGFLVSKRLAHDEVAGTLQTGGVAPGQPGSSWPSHPTEPRGISLEEAQRLASFPDQFMFVPRDKPGTIAYERLMKTKPGDPLNYGLAKRLGLDEPAPTVRAGDGTPNSSWFFHPVEMRGISLTEAKRIGSFPDQFGFGDWRAGCRQIGNCVPPLLMRAVAEVLARHGESGDMSDFKREAYARTPRGSKAKNVLGLFTRLAWGAVAPTVMRQFGMYGVAGLYHPDEPRPLTVGEYRRIASFPDGFKFGEWLDAVAQMGNCVPPIDVCCCKGSFV